MIKNHWWLVLMLLVPACDKSPTAPQEHIGQTVPPLVVEDLFNQPAIIKPSPGKLLMINVWATWCPPCRHEMPSLQRLAARLGNDRFELVGLAVDTDEHVVREYLNDSKITFPSFLDRDMSEVNGVLGVRLFPSTFFVAPDGKLLKVIESWRDWDAPELEAEIRALLPPASAK